MLQIPETSVSDTVAPDTTLAPDTTVIAQLQPRPIPTLGPDNGLLRALPAGVSDRRQLDAADECNSLSPSGAATDCGAFTAEGTNLRWVRYKNSDSSVQQIDVLAAEDSDEIVWDVKLRSKQLPLGATIRTGTGLAPMVVTARRADAAQTLEFDVVEGGDPGVSLHLELVAGKVRVSSDRIDAWNGVPRAGDSAGSPSQFDHWVIERNGGSWAIISTEAVTPDQVPS